MAEHSNYLLLGGGLTSASAAKSIRARDEDGSVSIIGAEPYLPYDRPPLSKNLLQDPSLTAGDIASVDDSFYTEKNVRVMTGISAESIDRKRKIVRTSDGEEYAYDKLLIATGSTPRKLKAEGSGLERVLYLRTYDDSLRLRNALDHAQSAVLIGAGYIGMEIAAACVAKKVQATIIEPKDQPWSKFASKTLGGFLQRHYEEQGVRFLFGNEVTRIDDPGGRLVLWTKLGASLSADVVLAGVGVSYNTEIATECGLDVDDKGRLRVDKTLRTADDSIWSAGDYAAYFDEILGKEFNAEHYMNAKWQGATVGRNMTGAQEQFAQVPYFFSDMGELHMVLRGNSDDASNTRIIGDMATEEFVELYADQGGTLKMAIAIGHDDKKLDELSNRFEDLIKKRVQLDEVAEGELTSGG